MTNNVFLEQQIEFNEIYYSIIDNVLQLINDFTGEELTRRYIKNIVD